MLARRSLLRAAGAVVATFTLRPAFAEPDLPQDMGKQRSLDGWVRIDPPGTVTIFTGKAELGQGVLTALSQIAAEGLDVEFGRIAIIGADTAQTPDEGQTSGSQSIEYGGEALRAATAEARALLIATAAVAQRVPAERLVVEDGTIRDPQTGRSTTYWQVASTGLLHRNAVGGVPQKPASAHRVIGKSIPRIDIPPKVSGGEIYVQDMRLPGMLHGRVIRPPSYGAVLTGVDEAAIRAMPGVVSVVRNGSFLGVIALREEQAIAARNALVVQARWQQTPSLPDSAKLPDALRAMPKQVYKISDKASDTPAPAGKTYEAEYSRPYIAHASIGPSCAVAQMQGDTMQVWSHTQGVFPLRRNLAELLGMQPDKVQVAHRQGSGCYGHNGADDVAADAALLARAVPGKPVRVQWMRDDEFTWEPYGAAMVTHARATLDQGKIVDWNYEIWSPPHSTRPGEGGGNSLIAGWAMDPPQPPGVPKPAPQPNGSGDRNGIPLYEFPRQQVIFNYIPGMPVRVSALRTLGATTNVFAIESFMDELALAAGADPVAFRLAHLRDPRAIAVIEAAAKLAGWQSGAKGGKGAGRGFAFAKYKNLMAYVAVVADITVDRETGGIRVRKMSAAVDAGETINPDGLRNQIEGGIIQAVSWCTKEQVRFDRTRILSRDWSGYPILAFPEVPAVEIALIDRPGERALGVGEASCGPATAAVANALFHATGVRLRDMPLAPEHVRAAWI
jgi:nicotinate dehydrogenase subunit B